MPPLAFFIIVLFSLILLYGTAWTIPIFVVSLIMTITSFILRVSTDLWKNDRMLGEVILNPRKKRKNYLI